jgi:hypothetical protein
MRKLKDCATGWPLSLKHAYAQRTFKLGPQQEAVSLLYGRAAERQQVAHMQQLGPHLRKRMAPSLKTTQFGEPAACATICAVFMASESMSAVHISSQPAGDKRT